MWNHDVINVDDIFSFIVAIQKVATCIIFENDLKHNALLFITKHRNFLLT